MGKELSAQRIVSKAVVEEALNKFICETYGDGASQINTPMRELGNPMELRTNAPATSSPLAMSYQGIQPLSTMEYRDDQKQDSDEDEEETIESLKNKMKRLEFSNTQLTQQVEALMAAIGKTAAPVKSKFMPHQQEPPVIEQSVENTKEEVNFQNLPGPSRMTHGQPIYRTSSSWGNQS
jgi:hypothetical protein